MRLEHLLSGVVRTSEDDTGEKTEPVGKEAETRLPDSSLGNDASFLLFLPHILPKTGRGSARTDTEEATVS